MINKIIEKVGAKTFAALSALVTALVSILLHEIDKYFSKKKYFQKGVDAARKEWEEQEKFWKKKVKDIQESTDLTLKEKVTELQQLKKAFKEYVKKSEKK